MARTSSSTLGMGWLAALKF